MIDSYHFGHVVVDGKEYSSDIIIYPDHIQDHWWRKSGHSLALEDIAEVIQYYPDVLIIGCGADEVLKIPREIEEYIEKKGIRLIAEDTKRACESYNKLFKEKRVVAGLHLTC